MSCIQNQHSRHMYLPLTAFCICTSAQGGDWASTTTHRHTHTTTHQTRPYSVHTLDAIPPNQESAIGHSLVGLYFVFFLLWEYNLSHAASGGWLQLVISLITLVYRLLQDALYIQIVDTNWRIQWEEHQNSDANGREIKIKERKPSSRAHCLTTGCRFCLASASLSFRLDAYHHIFTKPIECSPLEITSSDVLCRLLTTLLSVHLLASLHSGHWPPGRPPDSCRPHPVATQAACR